MKKIKKLLKRFESYPYSNTVAEQAKQVSKLVSTLSLSYESSLSYLSSKLLDILQLVKYMSIPITLEEEGQDYVDDITELHNKILKELFKHIKYRLENDDCDDIIIINRNDLYCPHCETFFEV